MFNRIVWAIAYLPERWSHWLDRKVCGWLDGKCPLKKLDIPESAWRCDLYWRCLGSLPLGAFLGVLTFLIFALRWLVYLPIKWTCIVLFGYMIPGPRIFAAADRGLGKVSSGIADTYSSAKERWCKRVWRPGVHPKKPQGEDK